jgi:hypothetical protein
LTGQWLLDFLHEVSGGHIQHCCPVLSHFVSFFFYQPQAALSKVLVSWSSIMIYTIGVQGSWNAARLLENNPDKPILLWFLHVDKLTKDLHDENLRVVHSR